MKRLLSFTLLSIITFHVNAQVRLGLKAGVNYSKISYNLNDPNSDLSSKNATSFMFGGVAEFKLKPSLFLQPGLTLNGHSGNFTETGEETKINLMYLTIPVNLVGKFDVGMGALSIGAGPYFDLALSGKATSGGESETIKFGNTVDDYFKSTDFGMNLLTGYELKNGMNFNLGYQLGLSNTTPKAFSDGVSSKNSRISLSVGFMF